MFFRCLGELSLAPPTLLGIKAIYEVKLENRKEILAHLYLNDKIICQLIFFVVYPYSSVIHWNPEELGFSTEMKMYKDEQILVFTQKFQKALNGTNSEGQKFSFNRVSSSFPSLEISEEENLGHLSFAGTMAGWAAMSVANSINSTGN